MSTLYRCKARVGYKPFKSDQLILFDERQIQDLSVKLKWESNLAAAQADKTTIPSAATNALGQSRCSVTISDPYLTGIAWPALYDAASLYTASTISNANGILLPSCEEGQDPVADKCAKRVDIGAGDDPSETKDIDPGGGFAMLYISLWYNVAGTSFGTDFYFRVDGFSVSHGGKYPSVTIKGIDARSVIFNQSLVNLAFEEGAEVEEVLKKIVEDMGYEPQFCANTNEFPEKRRLLPRSIRFKGVTPDEAIRKIVNSVNGNTLSLPTQQWANKVSICARGEVQQGCSVFYLGRGLYEGYEINGTPELGLIPLNIERGLGLNNGDPYASESFESNLYAIQDLVPNLRKEALKEVKKLPFPQQFAPVSPHLQSASRANGFAWKDAKPPQNTNKKGVVVINERLKDVNLFGVRPNGDKAISFLPGRVKEAIPGENGTGRVTIDTNFGLYICKPEDDKKCFARQIRQETSGLKEVRVKANTDVKVSEEIGSSTAEKPELTRFFIEGHKGEHITLNPQIVWDWAIPQGNIKQYFDSLRAQAAPVSSAQQVVPKAPPATLKDWSAVTTQKPNKILITPGHGDITRGQTGAPGEKELMREVALWMQRNAARYGIQDYVEFSIPPPTTNIPNARDPRALWSQGERVVNAGGKAIDLHMDKFDGNSGVIPPCGASRNKIGVLDDELAKAYGAFRKDWGVEGRPGCLGGPGRGVTILELGRMDGPTSTAAESSDPAIRERLYAQLADPLMRAIAAEKNRSGPAAAPSAPSPTNTPPPVSGPTRTCFKMGNSGTSTGPHVHIQWAPRAGERNSRPISLEDARRYIDVQGTFTSGYGPRWGTTHRGIDIANAIGTPICLKPGVTLVEAVVTKCPNNVNAPCGSGGGFGNFVEVATPEGKMWLAHLSPDSDFTGTPSISISSGGGKGISSLQSSPVTQGLLVETSFKGVPRALRIIPGRTILSFISDYDEWVENGGPRGLDNDRDPGIWIPSRFKNWFVKTCDYKWRDGDLRVSIEGASQWGTSKTNVPTFPDYIDSLRKSGEIKNTNDYYGYIRSIGDLHWKVEDDGKLKDSTEIGCPEAQAWAELTSSGTDTTTPGGAVAPTNVQSAYPTAQCQYTGSKYPRDRVQGIINAARAGGITSKAGFAGVVGNALEESTTRLDPGISNLEGSGAFGIFQWLGPRRRDLEAHARGLGKSPSDFGAQMSWFVKELKGADFAGPSTVQQLNQTNDPTAAAFIFGTKFERALINGVPNTLQNRDKRERYAREIFNDLSCS